MIAAARNMNSRLPNGRSIASLAKAARPGMRRPGDGEESEFEQADDDRCPLDAPVGAGGDDGEQRRRGEGQGQARDRP